jgi:tyrosinase
MWQDLYTPQTNEWLKTDDPDEGPQVELRPFPDAEGNLFTSRTCTFKHQKFGYTYPELKKWQFTKDGQFDEVAYIDSITKEIERLYSTTAKAALLLKSNETVAKKQMAAMTAENIKVENFPAPLLDMVPAPVLDGAQNPLGDVTAISEESFGDPESTSWKSNDYVANVVYERYPFIELLPFIALLIQIRFALGGRPYSITLFLGDVPAHSAYDFGEDVTAVGRVYNFSSTVEGRGTDETGCENCKKQQEEGALFSGQVILTDYLIERVMLAEEQRGLTLTSLNRDEVVEYLKKNLHWRITDVSLTLLVRVIC